MSESIVKASTAPVPVPEAIERVLVTGDLSALSPQQRVEYYNATCKSLGLNPLTRPFDYSVLNGKTVLYARKDCTEQLRKIHGVSLRVSSRELVGDVYVVTVTARDTTGREDESTGAVAVAGLKGENLANAYMKAETKAKRRATLSLCGLGLLDETEVASVQGLEAAGAIPATTITTRQLPQRASAAAPANMTKPNGVIDAEVVAPKKEEVPPTNATPSGVQITIASVGQRSGVTNNKPWTIHEITSTEGNVYKTFNNDIAKAAEMLKGHVVKLVLETNPKNGRVTVADILSDGDPDDGPQDQPLAGDDGEPLA